MMMELLCSHVSGISTENCRSFISGWKSRNVIDPLESRVHVLSSTGVKRCQGEIAFIKLNSWPRYSFLAKCCNPRACLPDFCSNSLHGRTNSGHGSLNCTSVSREGLSTGHVKILFAAGGTGGHVYPAIAVAKEVQGLDPNSQIRFVGSKDRMEWSAVPKAGYSILPITAVGLRRPYTSLQNLLLPFKLLLSMWMSWKILQEFRPDVVVGTGGYISAPLCLVAALRGYPLVIQEQNACPGITNRILSQFAVKIFVAFASAVSLFPKDKCALRGNPTRLTFNRYISSAVSRRLFFPNGLSTSLQTVRRVEDCEQGLLDSGSPEVLLILGGSLGARSINLAVSGMVLDMLKKFPRRHVIWQTGVKHYDEMVRLVEGHPRLSMSGFIDQMEMGYAAAHLVVARAGALTCSEILVAGKPSILVPSSNVAEDHQMKNAIFMVQTGASKFILDIELNSETLETVINDTLGSKELLRKMSANALKSAAPYAARQIAEEVLLIARKKESGATSAAHVCYT